MAKEPLFFKDTGEMGDVFAVAKQIIEQTRLSRDERARVSAITEERLKVLTGKVVEYDTLNAETNEYKRRIHELRVKLLRGELTGEDAKKALDALAGERDALQKKYGDLVGLLDTQMKNIDSELESIEKRELTLAAERDQYHSALHMEVKWIAEGEIKEIEGLKEILKKKRQSLVEEKSLIFIKKDELSESFSLVDDVIGKKSKRYVSVDDACAHELNFIARFDMKMCSFPVKCFSPHEGMTYTVTEWKSHYHYDAGTGVKAGGNDASVTDTRNLPLNLGSVYAIEEKDFAYFGKGRKTVVVETFSYCNTGDYAELGFDTRMVTMSALMTVLAPIIQRAEEGDYFHALGIASPTGWDDPAIAWVKGGDAGSSYVSKNVAVCLVDSASGEVYYNPNDLRILSYIDYFRPEFDRERVEKMKKILRDEFANVEYLEFEKIYEKTKEDRFIIEQAFYALERENVGKVKFADGVGLVFLR
ncbi:MAG: hypothetical protein NTZ39_02935 [Methanoregula sp.]|nr:hypothetical protein [Methanoregula sp.]